MTQTAIRVFAIGAASAMALAQFVISTPALAACRQVFTNTTCSGWGPFQKCANNFRTVCDSPVARVSPGAPAPRQAVNPAANLAGTNGGRLVSTNGGNLLSDLGSQMRPR